MKVEVLNVVEVVKCCESFRGFNQKYLNFMKLEQLGIPSCKIILKLLLTSKKFRNSKKLELVYLTLIFFEVLGVS